MAPPMGLPSGANEPAQVPLAERNEPTFEPTGHMPFGQRSGILASPQVSVAEDARFELARGCPQHAFQACALGH
jgi:hypothetical protein